MQKRWWFRIAATVFAMSLTLLVLSSRPSAAEGGGGNLCDETQQQDLTWYHAFIGGSCYTPGVHGFHTTPMYGFCHWTHDPC